MRVHRLSGRTSGQVPSSSVYLFTFAGSSNSRTPSSLPELWGAPHPAVSFSSFTRPLFLIHHSNK